MNLLPLGFHTKAVHAAFCSWSGTATWSLGRHIPAGRHARSPASSLDAAQEASVYTSRPFSIPSHTAGLLGNQQVQASRPTITFPCLIKKYCTIDWFYFGYALLAACKAMCPHWWLSGLTTQEQWGPGDSPATAGQCGHWARQRRAAGEFQGPAGSEVTGAARAGEAGHAAGDFAGADGQQRALCAGGAAGV